MSKLSNPTEIRDILARHGFRFSKSLGQNFLIDSTVCPKMAALCGAENVEGVIEVGPGIGVLTWELSQVAKKVVAVELDKSLLPVLEDSLKECSNVKVLNDDIMQLDVARLIEEEFSGGPVVVCANLPYYITSPIIMGFLESGLAIESLTVMVQREAAQRICARPGEKNCGAVSVSVHYHSRPEILFNVKRGAFMPPPNVDSSVIRLELLKRPPVELEDKEFFFKIARGAFSQRRKTLANSVSSVTGIEKLQIQKALESLGLDVGIRAERMTLENFADLSNLMLKKFN